MNLTSIPYQIIIFFATQTAAVVWFFIKLYFKVESMSKKVSELDSENKELKKQLSDLKDILIKVENNTHLLMLGRIKTGAKETK
jgi:cell division protein FtsB